MRTRPFAELKARVLTDPESRAAVASCKRAMENALVLAEFPVQQNAARQEPGRDADPPQTTIPRIEHEGDI